MGIRFYLERLNLCWRCSFMLLNAGLCCGPAARAKARWQARAYAAFMSRVRWDLSRLYPLLCRVIAACLHGVSLQIPLFCIDLLSIFCHFPSIYPCFKSILMNLFHVRAKGLGICSCLGEDTCVLHGRYGRQTRPMRGCKEGMPQV